ncbi:dTDP-4-dehydrorhamnose 3,5-epimerase [Silvimonas iriomotensis]|uniref:dTDP-4-dehydrorhamnose 3,5-epimerase n=1 Tax=Silvimonas iriomotensis TaxID=449662 RepID=A0ABQ2PEA2_9NEIS|nr:dTDP-4-dehydrorhamnose 3,5-epimerase [Silvimonas iriomotensis]GGP23646.1 dTDP-4-dehydrorhamnose 3,5-epimerase [Silvimonas iriomotensis]
MNVVDTALHGVKIIEPRVFGDERGYFFESFNSKRFEEATGVAATFVQDNQSRSVKDVLRGLHYQIGRPQGKLVRVLQGEIHDVVVDLRTQSPTFGRWESYVLSAENKKQLWVPEGFAHGFLTLSSVAEVFYKTTDYWAPECERTIRWDDPDLGIDWGGGVFPQVSQKDSAGGGFASAEKF